MKIKEIEETLNETNCYIKVVHYNYRTIYELIDNDNVSISRITSSQFEKIQDKLKCFKSDYKGFTKHYYKLKTFLN